MVQWLWSQIINWCFCFITFLVPLIKPVLTEHFTFTEKKMLKGSFPSGIEVLTTTIMWVVLQGSYCEIFDQRPDLTFQRLWEVGLCLLTPSQEKWLIKAIEFSIWVGKQRLNLNEKTASFYYVLGPDNWAIIFFLRYPSLLVNIKIF